MPKNLLADEMNQSTLPSRQPRNLLYESSEEQEPLLTSIAAAPFRVAEDVGNKAYEFYKKLPEYYEKAKTEVPAALNFTKKDEHAGHRIGQSVAGVLEGVNSIYQLPKNLNKYLNQRLKLAPDWSVPMFEKLFPSAEGVINKGFDKPKYPGEELSRGIGRNIANIVPAANALNKLKSIAPSNIFRGALSPEELKNNLRITQGTETGLGDVIGSPFLKRMNENILTKIPFSGVTESMQRNAGNIINKGHNLLYQLAGESDIGNLDQYLNDALKESFNSHQSEKNAHYSRVNKLADEVGLNLDLPEFAKKASEHKNAIQDTNIIKYDPEMQSLLGKLGLYENPVKTEKRTGKIVDEYGSPLLNETKKIYPSLQEANLLKGKLNNLANQHGASSNPSDRHLAGVFGGLARTLKQDIQEGIEKSGHEGLKTAYKEAEENYGKKFSPFLDKQIYKFINGSSDPETLVSSFIKTGKSTDRANLINKLTKKLPFEDRNLLGYAYLQRAMDENNVLNPMKLKTLLSKNSLGNKQFEALFPNPVLRNALRDYVDLVDMNTKSLKVMWNPETGQMNMDVLPLLSKSPTNFLAKVMGAPYVGKKLRSEKTRTKLVNKMIKKSK